MDDERRAAAVDRVQRLMGFLYSLATPPPSEDPSVVAAPALAPAEDALLLTCCDALGMPYPVVDPAAAAAAAAGGTGGSTGRVRKRDMLRAALFGGKKGSSFKEDAAAAAAAAPVSASDHLLGIVEAAELPLGALLTDVLVLYGSEPAPEGYTRVPGARAGASLCVKRAVASTDPIVVAVVAVLPGNGEGVPPGFFPVLAARDSRGGGGGGGGGGGSPSGGGGGSRGGPGDGPGGDLAALGADLTRGTPAGAGAAGAAGRVVLCVRKAASSAGATPVTDLGLVRWADLPAPPGAQLVACSPRGAPLPRACPLLAYRQALPRVDRLCRRRRRPPPGPGPGPDGAANNPLAALAATAGASSEGGGEGGGGEGEGGEGGSSEGEGGEGGWRAELLRPLLVALYDRRPAVSFFALEGLQVGATALCPRGTPGCAQRLPESSHRSRRRHWPLHRHTASRVALFFHAFCVPISLRPRRFCCGTRFSPPTCSSPTGCLSPGARPGAAAMAPAPVGRVTGRPPAPSRRACSRRRRRA